MGAKDGVLAVGVMRLSSCFLCPTLRLLPEASHLARIRLLFRVARTARKHGVGRRSQWNWLWIWFHGGGPPNGAITGANGAITGGSIMRPVACGKCEPPG